MGALDRVRKLFSRSTPRGEQRQTIKQPSIGRHPYAGHRVLPGISPKRLADVLRAADEGLPDEFLIAAQELEERDAQYGALMQVRRAAVSALELQIHKPSGVGSRAAKAAQELVDSGTLKELVHYSLDALGKGYSITEIVWEDRNGWWWPRFVQHDPWHFRYTDDDRFVYRDRLGIELELQQHKWVQHIPLGRTGIPIRRGCARPAMFLHMAKSMSIAGWVQLMAVFGLPIAIATVPQQSTANDRAVLTAALAGLGQGNNAILPTGAVVDIVKAADAGSSPEKMYSVLLDYVDKQISKLVLGQTMTADDGASQSQATVHDKVRRDIREGDAEQLAATLSRDVLRPFIDFNVGAQRVYPELSFLFEEERDLEQWSKAVFGFVDRGLPVLVDDIYPMLGLSKPRGIPDGQLLSKVAKPAEPVKPSAEENSRRHSLMSVRRARRHRSTSSARELRALPRAEPPQLTLPG